MLLSIETYRICDFPGGPGPHTPLDPRMRMIDPLAMSSVKPIPNDRFFHAMVHFPFLELLVTPQNMMRYMILQYVSGRQMLICFVCLICFFTSHQRSLSYKGTGLPGLNQY